MKRIRLIVVLLCCCFIGMHGQGVNPVIDRLQQSLELLHDNRAKVDTINELAFEFIFVDVNRALQYALQADSIAIRIDYLTGRGTSQIRLGQARMFQSKFDESEIHLKKGLNLRLQNGDPFDVFKAYTNLGAMHTKAGNIYGAIDSYKLGIGLLDDLSITNREDSVSVAKMYNNLGKVLKDNGQYKKAEHHLKKSIGLYEHLGTELNLARACMNLGSLYYIEGFMDTLKSHSYLNRSLALFINIKNNKGLGKCYINLGNLFFHQNKNEKALAYYAKAKEKSKFLPKGDMITIARNEGSVFFKNEEYDKALKVYETCLEEYEDSGNRIEMAKLYHDIGNVHFVQSDFEKANLYLNKSLESADDLKLFGLKNTSLFSIVNVQESELYKEQLQRKTTILVGLLVLVMVLTIVGFLFRMNRRKRLFAEQNALLAKQEIDVLVGHQVLKTTSARLEGIEQERKRIAEDLHDVIGVKICTAKLYFAPMDKQLENLEDEDRNKYQRATQILDETYDAVRRISHDMAAPSLSNLGLVNELQLLVNKIEEAKLLKINLNVYEMQERLDNNIEIRLYRIIQELLTNALKHAKATEINIGLNHFNNFINVIVEDNGIGFDQKLLKSTDGSGIGLKNIKKRVEDLKGTFTIDSKTGRGTNITLDIPLQN